MTTSQALQYKMDVEKLPPFALMADAIDRGERFVVLDSITTLSRDGIKEFIKESTAADQAGILEKTSAKDIAWDFALRRANQFYDRFATASRMELSDERSKKFSELKSDLAEMAKRAKEGSSADIDTLPGQPPEEVVAARIVDVLLKTAVAPMAIDFCQFRRQVDTQMSASAVALAAYRADHGKYPTALADLVPKYLANVPFDIFSRDLPPIRYRIEKTGYLLWSVGLNGKDDGGRDYREDESVTDLSDDWLFRPVPKEKVSSN
jgi:hypothetical protein